MNLALAAYNDRIASLFESSNQFIFVKIPNSDDEQRQFVTINDSSILKLIQVLKSHQADVLICGAINGCSFRTIQSNDIHVLPWITGDVESVIRAYMTGELENFTMPGCQSRRRHRKGMGNRHGGRL